MKLNLSKLKDNLKLKIILVNNISLILIAVVFYWLIPIVLNYPPYSLNNQFQKEIDGLTYTQQYIIIILFMLFINLIYLLISLRGINKIIYNYHEMKKQDFIKLRKRCFNFPYVTYIVQTLMPVLAIVTIYSITCSIFDVATLKLCVMTYSFSTLSALVSFMLSRNIFVKVLLKKHMQGNKDGMKISLKAKVFIQFIPMFLVAIFFTSLVGYSRVVKDKSDITYDLYKSELKYNLEKMGRFNNLEQLKNATKNIELKNIEDFVFICTPKKEIITPKDKELSEFFIKYMNEISPSHGNRVFEYYGEDQGGAYTKLKSIDNKEWIIGVKYTIVSFQTVMYFIICFIVLVIINAVGLYYFSKVLAEDISRVTRGLTDIVRGGKVNLYKKLPITSNDEIADLVIAFNNIEDLEKQNIKKIRDSQDILMQQEKLASLGQLIGGIAHNLKTPIMAISGATEALKDLIKEYDEAIDDSDVTKEDHHDIAKDMTQWIEKIKPYCTYMSEVISAVKDQAVQSNLHTNNTFKVDELIKRIDILMKHALSKNYITLNIQMEVDKDVVINGQITTLIQVINNLIANAIDAYEGQKGTIDFIIKKDYNNIVFVIKDYAKGIPKEAKQKLFKEMITTKGKNGTGLGLYISYSTIKGKFGGKITFASAEGKGTTFYVTIPIENYTKENENENKKEIDENKSTGENE